MADETSKELEAQIAELQAKAAAAKTAEAAEKYSRMSPDELMIEALRTITSHLGNHPHLEALVNELEKRSAPPSRK